MDAPKWEPKAKMGAEWEEQNPAKPSPPNPSQSLINGDNWSQSLNKHGWCRSKLVYIFFTGEHIKGKSVDFIRMFTFCGDFAIFFFSS